MSLQLHKLDLHVHTPASHDFLDKTVSAGDIVARCQEIGLSAIAVTDHNTVDFIDKMKTAAKAKGFTIFPGVEVSCGATQSGSIHVIALFDPRVDKDDLQRVLGKLDVSGAGRDALTQKSPADVIDIINQAGGLAVLAHANSTHGALSDIRGNPRAALVKNKNLSAVEATSGDFDGVTGKKRLIDVLDGEDPVYLRKLAVYKASDNPIVGKTGHCLETIGSHFTYFRMGALTLESLRECFEDRDSRIIQDYELEKIASAHPRIEQLEIRGGFLDRQTIPFHHGMNSIIGGTGTGKSLTIELLRFVFDRKPPEVLMSDHKQKLQKQLRIHGEVTVIYRDGSGTRYKICRKYENPRDPYSSAVSCVNIDSGKAFSGDLSSLVPLLIYSQNEILEITRDEHAQLGLLDNFQDLDTYQNQVTEIRQNLGRLDQKLHQAIEDSANCEVLKKQLQNTEVALEKLSKQIGIADKSKASKPYLALSAERTAIEEKIEEFDPLLELIDDAIEAFKENAPTGKVQADTIGAIDTSLRASYSVALGGLKATRKDVEKAHEQARIALRGWDKRNKYQQLEKEYVATVTLKKREEGLETKRRSLLDEKKGLVARITQAEKAAKQDGKFRAERETLLATLGETKTRYFTERSKQAELITTKAGGKLRIAVQAGDNRSAYTGLLKDLAVGSYAEKKEIDRIVSQVTPVEFVRMVLDRNAKALAKRADISEQKAEAIVTALNETGVRLKTMSMQYDGYPEDRIEIAYQKRDGQYYPLSELSMGQKADALIMIALGDGAMPVVIDQPEDALDIPSIWANICSRLRISKHVRQFVFTTHNSSISVSSDSDQFIVFEADGRKGWVARSGSIDEQAIKDDVVDHLEGGYKSYELKRKKYGL
ncbi:MAG: PHP domain-containing protein [Gemmatimonadaceae bacterium]